MEFLYLDEIRYDFAACSSLERVVDLLFGAGKIIVVAGAGMSVDAGVPDFRSASGLFRAEQHRVSCLRGKDLFDSSVHRTNAALHDFHKLITDLFRVCSTAKPTTFHNMLNTLSEEGRLLRLYSQNVDGLDCQMKYLSTTIPLDRLPSGEWPKTVQLHGSIQKMVCSLCQAIFELDPAHFTSGERSSCPDCERIQGQRARNDLRVRTIGKLRPRISLYNETGFDGEAIEQVVEEDAQNAPDLLLVVGTTLTVYGTQRLVRQLSKAVRASGGGQLIWLNSDDTRIPKVEGGWDLVIIGDCQRLADHTGMGLFA